MPKPPHAWICHKFDSADLVHLGTRLRTSLSSFTFASPTCAPTALCAVLKLSNVAGSVLRATNDRTSQRKRLAQRAASNPLATQPKSSPHRAAHHLDPSIQPVPFEREDSMPRLPRSALSALYLSAQPGMQHLPLWQHLKCPVDHISVTFSCALDRFLRFYARDAGLSRDIAILSRGPVRHDCPCPSISVHLPLASLDTLRQVCVCLCLWRVHGDLAWVCCVLCVFKVNPIRTEILRTAGEKLPSLSFSARMNRNHVWTKR